MPRAVSSDLAAFRRLLAEDMSAWGLAKAEAFDRLCELSPGPGGPTTEATLRVLRRRHRCLPPEWREPFVQACHQWLGYAQVRGAGAAPPPRRLTLDWWTRPVPPLREHPVLGCLVGSRMALAFLLVVAAILAAGRIGARQARSPVRIAPPAQATRAAAEILRCRSLVASGRDEDFEAVIAGADALLREYRGARRALLQPGR